MPFTLSHPVAVLIAPQSKYLHQSALVIGSMAPDFINYVNIATFTKFGHTTLGAFVLDLPLCFMVYYLHLYLIAPYFWRHLPNIISLQTNEKPITSMRLAVTFCVSALLGIFSHIFLDWLLHRSSDMLVTFDFIQPYHQGLRIYRLYHFGISVLCLFIIVLYLIVKARKQSRDFSTATITTHEKFRYWLFVSFITVAILGIWNYFNPFFLETDKDVVRIVDALFIGLLSTGLIYHIVKPKVSRYSVASSRRITILSSPKRLVPKIFWHNYTKKSRLLNKLLSKNRNSI